MEAINRKQAGSGDKIALDDLIDFISWTSC
jgi:hypothetical protein